MEARERRREVVRDMGSLFWSVWLGWERQLMVRGRCSERHGYGCSRLQRSLGEDCSSSLSYFCQADEDVAQIHT